MTTSKLVTINLSAGFIVEGKTEEELLANAKIALLKQLEEGKFPSYTYSINDEKALTFENVNAGQIVEYVNGELGIITAVNQKTINVALTGRRLVQGHPESFRQSDASFEQARSIRGKDKDDWSEGHSGYVKNKDEIHEVVVGKITRGKAKVHIINTNRYFPVPESQLSLFIKDDKKELK